MAPHPPTPPSAVAIARTRPAGERRARHLGLALRAALAACAALVLLALVAPAPVGAASAPGPSAGVSAPTPAEESDPDTDAADTAIETTTSPLAAVCGELAADETPAPALHVLCRMAGAGLIPLPVQSALADAIAGGVEEIRPGFVRRVTTRLAPGHERALHAARPIVACRTLLHDAAAADAAPGTVDADLWERCRALLGNDDLGRDQEHDAGLLCRRVATAADAPAALLERCRDAFDDETHTLAEVCRRLAAADAATVDEPSLVARCRSFAAGRPVHVGDLCRRIVGQEDADPALVERCRAHLAAADGTADRASDRASDRADGRDRNDDDDGDDQPPADLASVCRRVAQAVGVDAPLVERCRAHLASDAPLAAACRRIAAGETVGALLVARCRAALDAHDDRSDRGQRRDGDAERDAERDADARANARADHRPLAPGAPGAPRPDRGPNR